MEVAMASPRSENADPVRTLGSWKEIAVFLNHSESTVKRWERDRGLPVHRLPGGERGGVFAYSDELAAWLKGEAFELEVDDPASGDPDTAGSIGTGPAGTLRRVEAAVQIESAQILKDTIAHRQTGHLFPGTYGLLRAPRPLVIHEKKHPILFYGSADGSTKDIADQLSGNIRQVAV